MCTYNGEPFLREQLDSILEQSRHVDEIIVQDDGSTDGTYGLLLEYEEKHKEVHVFKNEGEKGVNPNFFSAMRRATGDYIAISDQDDVWAEDKIERQLEAIGDKLLCASFSQPFTTSGAEMRTDMRTPNYSILRLLYVSGVSGHTLFFSKRMLDMMPPVDEITHFRFYDAVLLLVATAYESMVFVASPLVRHRIHTTSASYAKPVDNGKTIANIVSTATRTWLYFWELRPEIRRRMAAHLRFLSLIDARTESLSNAKRMLSLQCRRGLMSFVALQFFCIRHCDELFYAKEKRSLFTRLRAAYFPISCSDYYRYLSKRWQKKNERKE